MTPRRVGRRPRSCWPMAPCSGAAASARPRHAVGEVCFNTSMTGYQEIITDPSYAGQIITFTFPHIGNVGTNLEDIESINPAARGVVLRGDITDPANWRAAKPLDDWLKSHNLPGICGIDTRELTRRIRDGGAPNGVVVHAPDGKFDIPKLRKVAVDWPGLDGMDLAIEVTTKQSYALGREHMDAGRGLCEARQAQVPRRGRRLRRQAQHPALPGRRRLPRDRGAGDGDGRGHPAPQARRRVPVERPRRSGGDGGLHRAGDQGVLDKGVPLFGICLGHQLLALTLGGKTRKMERGHRGANQPVKDLTTGKVEITSQNHGFCVIPESLPKSVEVTHVSLFDGTNEGIRSTDMPAFSVQYHPEASPGPTDSHYLFKRFVEMIDKSKGK